MTTSKEPLAHNNRIIRIAEVEQLVGMRKSAIYKMIAAGEFPAQVKLGRHASGWIESEVLAWINVRASLRPASTTATTGTARSIKPRMGADRNAFLLGQTAGIVAVLSAIIGVLPNSARKQLPDHIHTNFETLISEMLADTGADADAGREGAEMVRDLFFSLATGQTA